MFRLIKSILGLVRPAYFSKNFETDSRDDMCYSSNVVMLLF